MKNFVSLFIILFLTTSIFAQEKTDNRTLMTINGKNISVDEFMYVYQKNNNSETSMTQKSLEDYIDLYVKFRLKVEEAKALGMDTLPSFLSELQGYRAQLARPYLSDKEVNENLLKEAYDRMQYDIRARHIMKLVPENMADDDAQAKAAYDELMEIRKRALKGEDFGALARQYSDDPSAKDQKANSRQPARQGNAGDLGYFTVFYMVYPFETAAYNTKVGEISMPIRTRFGYHLIKVEDKIPALGTIHVAHIVVNNSQAKREGDGAALKKINEIYKDITSGKISFEDAAKAYSDDKGSAEKGGVLNWFEVNKMVPEFIQGISEIEKPGDISKPIKTRYGYHIIKLIELRKPGTYEEMLSEIKNKVARDSRSNKSKEVAIQNFKNQYAFKDYPKNLNKFFKKVDTNLSHYSWQKPNNVKFKKKLFVLDGKTYTENEFADFVAKNQRLAKKGTLKFMLHDLYKKWVDQTVMAHKDSKLEEENFDFRMLVNEYHDGILLFNISDEKIWGRAIKDSLGLQKFYEAHIKDYMWEKRLETEIYRCKSDSLAQVVASNLKSGVALEDLVKKINKGSQLNLGYEHGKYQMGEHKILKDIEWTPGISKVIHKDNSFYVVRVLKVIEPEPKKINEARGIITADYQNYLHDQWIKELEKKYSVNINQEVLKSIEVQ